MHRVLVPDNNGYQLWQNDLYCMEGTPLTLLKDGQNQNMKITIYMCMRLCGVDLITYLKFSLYLLEDDANCCVDNNHVENPEYLRKGVGLFKEGQQTLARKVYRICLCSVPGVTACSWTVGQGVAYVTTVPPRFLQYTMHLSTMEMSRNVINTLFNRFCDFHFCSIYCLLATHYC